MSDKLSTSVKDFELVTDKTGSIKENIRHNIFLCEEVSCEIESYVFKENWGINRKELYHLLDYKFRVSCIKGDIKVYSFMENGEYKQISIFHTGLLRRLDNEHLFIICIRNSQKQPQWMVQPKPKKDSCIEKASQWLLTKDEIQKKYGKFGIIAPPLLNYGSRKQFNKNFRIYWNWYNIVKNQIKIKSKKKMIMETLNQYGIDTNYFHKNLFKILPKSFENGIKKTLKLLRQSEDYVKPGLFINKDKKSFIIDWMMYLKIQVYDKSVVFIVRFTKNKYKKQYNFVDLLNLKRGYQSGRQLSVLPSFWWYENKNMLQYYKNNNNNNNNNNIDTDGTSNTENDDIFNENNETNDNKDDNKEFDRSSESKQKHISKVSNISKHNNKTGYVPQTIQTIQNYVEWENNSFRYQLNKFYQYNATINDYILTKKTIWYNKKINKTTIHIQRDDKCISTLIDNTTSIILSKTIYIKNSMFIKYIGLDYQSNIQYCFGINLKNNHTSFNCGLIQSEHLFS